MHDDVMSRPHRASRWLSRTSRSSRRRTGDDILSSSPYGGDASSDHRSANRAGHNGAGDVLVSSSEGGAA